MLVGMLWLRVPVRADDCASWLRILALRNDRDVREEAGHLLEVKVREEAERLQLQVPGASETAA